MALHGCLSTAGCGFACFRSATARVIFRSSEHLTSENRTGFKIAEKTLPKVRKIGLACISLTPVAAAEGVSPQDLWPKRHRLSYGDLILLLCMHQQSRADVQYPNELSKIYRKVGIGMLVMFLQTAATLVSDLIGNVWSGSFMPGVDGVTGSLVSFIELS
ncbi:hypothetical protein [Rhodococcus sp. IEGM 1366]|uniref:hypothetical protein n=1 Tax=Rhodococcus sp. IEGM 1366 TaxID=3082223 RepID=UPI0029547E89|nr:hypothetical protein [Rhodococcus sp. IEGM 1366]